MLTNVLPFCSVIPYKLYVTATYPDNGLSGCRSTVLPVTAATSLSNPALAPVLNVVGWLAVAFTANHSACGPPLELVIDPTNELAKFANCVTPAWNPVPITYVDLVGIVDAPAVNTHNEG